MSVLREVGPSLCSKLDMLTPEEIETVFTNLAYPLFEVYEVEVED